MNQKVNRDHSFDIELAVIVGIEKAILLKNFDYWVRENERRGNSDYYQNGFWWTAESLNGLVVKYPYFKRTSIARWVKELAAESWLIIAAAEREVNYYRPGLIFSLWNAGEDWEAELVKIRLSQNGTEEGCTKMVQGLYQIRTAAVPVWYILILKILKWILKLILKGALKKKKTRLKAKKTGKREQNTRPAKSPLSWN